MHSISEGLAAVLVSDSPPREGMVSPAGHSRSSHDIIQALPVAVYTTDPEGRITFYNEAAAALWGVRPEIGKSEFCGSWKLYWPDGTPLPHDECPMALALRERKPNSGMEAIAERPDGTRVPFAPYPVPLWDENGEFIGALNTLVDLTNHKRGEEMALRLANVVESSLDAIVTKDRNGIITSWNRSAERLFGYKADEIIGKPVITLIPDDRLDEETYILGRILRGENVETFETIRRRKDGSLIDVSLTISPIRNAEGRVIGASKIARDITERRQAEKALRESQTQLLAELEATERLQSVSAELIREQGVEILYDKIVEAAAGIMRSDYASMQMLYPERGDGGELRLLASRGFDPESVKFWEWVRADSGCTCGMVLRTGKRAVASNVETCDFMAGTPDREAYLRAGMNAAQSTPLVSRSGRLLGMISTHWRNPHEPADNDLRRLDVLARQAADLIERAQANAALRESEARLRALVDQAASGVAEMDLTGRFMLVNQRFCDMLGYSEDELLRIRMQDVTHSDDLPRNVELLERLAQTGAGYVFEKRCLRKDGTVVWVSNSVSGLRDAGGKLTNAVAVSIDITERKQAESQRTLLLREMNHRVKNLFTVASSIVSLSARARTAPDDLVPVLQERLKALALAHQLTLPDLTDGATKADAATTLHALLQTILSPFTNGGEEHVHIGISGPDVPVSGPAVTSVALLLHEFATNASKYGALSSASGSVQVEWNIGDGKLALTWTERGGPRLDGQSKSEGFGSLLARGTMTQIGGSLSREWCEEGLVIHLSAPLDQLARARH